MPSSAPATATPQQAPKPPIAEPVLHLGKSTPRRVQISSIGLDTSLIGLGLTSSGQIEVPPDGFPAGWFTGAPTPGELGPAIVVGHVHWQRKDGVFAELGSVKPGDRIRITRADRSVAVFVVTRNQQVTKSSFPSEQVYGNIDFAGLRVITCGGYDNDSREYEDNVIVFARLVSIEKA